MIKQEIIEKFRILFTRAVQRNLSENILFSGGLDTSVIATIASNSKALTGYTCAFKEAPTPDVKYARIMAKKLGMNHFVHYFDEKEVNAIILQVVKILKTFDPMEVRNNITVLIGLKLAKEHNIDSVMTGDAADELLAGYHYFLRFEGEELQRKLRDMWKIMTFSSVPLGKALDIKVKTPFLDKDFKSFAMALGTEYKIREERGNKWGKWILRKAFEEILPEEITWRPKHPIEVGSGTTILPKLFAKRINNMDFECEKQKILEEDKVTIRDKEQLVYYKAFREQVGVPSPENPDLRTCPQCNSTVSETAKVCRTCGAYPITPEGQTITAERAYSETNADALK